MSSVTPMSRSRVGMPMSRAELLDLAIARFGARLVGPTAVSDCRRRAASPIRANASTRVRQVEAHHERQQQPVAGAVRDVDRAADRVLHRVDQRDAGVRERQPAERRGQGHAVAGFEVVAVLHRPPQELARRDGSPRRPSRRPAGSSPGRPIFSPRGSGNSSLSTAVNASMACVSASMPLSAVTFGGQRHREAADRRSRTPAAGTGSGTTP